MELTQVQIIGVIILLHLRKLRSYDIFNQVYYPGIKNTFFDRERAVKIPRLYKYYSSRLIPTNYTGKFNASEEYTSYEENKSTIDFNNELSYETIVLNSGKRVATYVKVKKGKRRAKKFSSDRRTVTPQKKATTPRSKRIRRNVYGRDDRSYIPITQSLGLAEPYSYTVKISTGCTGIIISPRHVLTAAHCVHDQKDYVSGSKQLLVGFFNVTNVIDWVGVKTMKVSKGWIEGGVANGPFFDYAVLKLKRKHSKPYITLSISEEGHHGTGERISFNSFDDDKPKDTMWYRSCSIIEDDPSFLYHYCDAKPGSSGSGVYTWVYDNDAHQWKRELIGVFSGNRWKIYDQFYIIVKNFNVAVRLTAARYAQICEWLGKYSKTVCKKGKRKVNNIVTKK